MKEEKMTGLLPEESGQCALRSKMKKPFTKDHSILALFSRCTGHAPFQQLLQH